MTTFSMPIQNHVEGYRRGPPELDGPFVWKPTRRDRARAEKNHSQTLERLASRGGMSWEEMARILLDLPLFGPPLPRPGPAYARACCYDALKMSERQQVAA